MRANMETTQFFRPDFEENSSLERVTLFLRFEVQTGNGRITEHRKTKCIIMFLGTSFCVLYIRSFVSRGCPMHYMILISLSCVLASYAILSIKVL
jgi:hypothetical protein